MPRPSYITRKNNSGVDKKWKFWFSLLLPALKMCLLFYIFFLRAILFLPGQILAICLFGKPKENLTLATHRVLATAMDHISRTVRNKLFLHYFLSTIVQLVSSKVSESHGIVTDLVGICIWHLKRPCIVSVTMQLTDLHFYIQF